MMEMVHEKYSTLLIEFIGTALTTILPSCSSIVINAVIVTTVVFVPKKEGHLKNISYDFFH